jgi:hypothetical protein
MDASYPRANERQYPLSLGLVLYEVEKIEAQVPAELPVAFMVF